MDDHPLAEEADRMSRVTGPEAEGDFAIAMIYWLNNYLTWIGIIEKISIAKPEEPALPDVSGEGESLCHLLYTVPLNLSGLRR